MSYKYSLFFIVLSIASPVFSNNISGAVPADLGALLAQMQRSPNKNSIVRKIESGAVSVPEVKRTNVVRYAHQYAVEETKVKKVKAMLTAMGITGISAYALYRLSFLFASEKEKTAQSLRAQGLERLEEMFKGLNRRRFAEFKTWFTNNEKKKESWSSWAWNNCRDIGSGLTSNLLWGFGLQGLSSCMMNVMSSQFPIFDFVSVRSVTWFTDRQTTLFVNLADIVHCVQSGAAHDIDVEYMQALVNSIMSQTEKILGFMEYRKSTCGKKNPVTQSLLKNYIKQFEREVVQCVSYVVMQLETAQLPLDVVAMNCNVKQHDIRLLLTHFVQVAQ